MRTVEPPPLRVPVGPGAERWTSRTAQRRVLLVVHNVTSAGRLLDILPLFHDDFRVQLLVTSTGSSVFQDGVGELCAELGLPVLPWEQALATPVDLAISASFGGQLPLIDGRLSVLSHGVGYTKKLAGSREPGAGSREPGAGSREPGAGSREPGAGSREPGAGSREPTFGLSAEWLLADGKPFVDGLVLSHPEQLDRLRSACPEMVDAAVLAGDPCFDRMLATRRYRDRFRRALGVRRGQRLVVVNSTWNPEGFFGDGQHDILPSLLPRLTAELPADDYRLAAVLHPNIWFGHGPGQIRAWLDRAVRSGLALIDPVHHWRQALLAADAVIGDFGAVSYYASALGTPVLIAASGEEKLDPEAPLAAFVEQAPRLDPYGPLEAQLARLIAGHRPQPGGADFVTSAPGRSAPLLRRHFYALLDLPEPATPALLEPLALPPHDPPSRTAPLHVRTRIRGTEIGIARSTGQPYGAYDADGETHLAVHEDTRDPSALELADVITRYGPADDARLGGAAAWTTEVLRLHPHCSAAAYVSGPGECLVRMREHGAFRLTAHPGSDVDPAAYASALHAWLAAGHTLPAGGIALHVQAAGAVHPVEVTADPGRPHSAPAGPRDSAGVESRRE